MSDPTLQERLRAKGESYPSEQYAGFDTPARFIPDPDAMEAADRIDELEASNAALREALEGLFYIEWTKRQIRDHSRQRDAARATLAEGEKP